MCGIFGFISNKYTTAPDMVEDACLKMQHRGPDDHGIYTNGPVTFGHRRLSIIDLSQGAQQPILSRDRRFAIVFNGEIYNFRELKKELQCAGYKFITNSDTEVLLYAYIEWKEKCLSRLNGMFAFAILDNKLKKIFLARDAFGIKPLFYRIGDYFAFSSELPPLVTLFSEPPSINPLSVALFFKYQYIPSPYTIYNNIYKLIPGHYMYIDFDGTILNEDVFFEFKQYKESNTNENIFFNKAKEILSHSIAEKIYSDVSIGVFLSGGIDSTIVALFLTRVLGNNIPAFTIDFNEHNYSELSYAKLAAKKLGVHLHTDIVDSSCIDNLPQILHAYGEPYGDSSVLPTWYLSKLARSNVKVALSGDGCDELFAGYSTYKIFIDSQPINIAKRILSFKDITPRLCYQFLKSLPLFFQGKNEFWHSLINYYSEQSLKDLLEENLEKFSNATAPRLKSFDNMSALSFAQLCDLQSYLPDCILPKVDITSMQHSLEVRPALLDTKIVDFAFSIPENLRYSPTYGGKVILKKILLDAGFPSDFVHRQKQGFAIPVNEWFQRGKLARTMLEDLLSTHKHICRDFLKIEKIYGLLTQHDNSKNIGNKLWLLLSFMIWIDSSRFSHSSK